MRWIFLGVAILAGHAEAADGIDSICPDTTRRAQSIPFPKDAPPRALDGEAIVAFTVDSDARVTDVHVESSTHKAFDEPAKTYVASLRCLPQPSSLRFKLPVKFDRPPIRANDACTNVREVLMLIEYPREAVRRGIEFGEVWIDFDLQPDGQIQEFYVMKSTGELFTIAAVRGLAKLKCNGYDKVTRIHMPFVFRLE